MVKAHAAGDLKGIVHNVDFVLQALPGLANSVMAKLEAKLGERFGSPEALNAAAQDALKAAAMPIDEKSLAATTAELTKGAQALIAGIAQVKEQLAAHQIKPSEALWQLRDLGEKL